MATSLARTHARIRRYTLDPRLRKPPKPGDPDPGAELRAMAEEFFLRWLALKEQFDGLPDPPPTDRLDAFERDWLALEHKVDLLQRELISEQSRQHGFVTVTLLALSLIALIFAYLWKHGWLFGGAGASQPVVEWGPLKYLEVAFWSEFGVLAWMLGVASWYLARRDFDSWYRPWYLATAVRAPVLTVVLMIIVLEFVEWYGEGKWIETYLLEEGNKTSFIAFLSFCLGLTSERTATSLGIWRKVWVTSWRARPKPWAAASARFSPPRTRGRSDGCRKDTRHRSRGPARNTRSLPHQTSWPRILNTLRNTA